MKFVPTHTTSILLSQRVSLQLSGGHCEYILVIMWSLSRCQPFSKNNCMLTPRTTRGNWRKKKKRSPARSGRNSCAQNAKASLQHPCSRPCVFSALDCRQNIIFNVSDEMTMALPLCALRPRLRTNIDFIELSQWTSLQLLGAHYAPACCDNTRNRPQISQVSSNKQIHLGAKTISPRSTMASCTVLMSPWEAKLLNGGDG